MKRATPRTGARWRVWVLLISLSGLAALAAPPRADAAGASTGYGPIPVLAYYYIWFDRTSWDRAKSDYPQLGRYSSDDETVIRQHVRWAKEAGIDGFIVSWKSTATLNRRLETLIRVADDERFKLAIIYQGLDFNRQPQPVERVASDLDEFARRYAGDRAFQLFPRPLVIWSGTWAFSPAEIARVTTARRDRLLILASERSVDSYQRLTSIVDGNAYYWSSVDPTTFPGYQQKLDGFSQAVHGHGGIWIAPAAPGFDARLIGGTRVVDRRDGETLRAELNAAIGSSPDAIGLISWNEFSENTHIEPSERYGRRYLDLLIAFQAAALPSSPDFDSSEPGLTGGVLGPIVLGALLVGMTGSFVVITRRAVRRRAALEATTFGERHR